MPQMDDKEVELVSEAVASCLHEQLQTDEGPNQIAGRSFVNQLSDLIAHSFHNGTPAYIILAGLWVTIVELSTGWKKDQERKMRNGRK